MKKIFILLLTAIAVVACNDDCDHVKEPISPDPVVFNYIYLSSGTGCWYEEEENEEFRPTVNGKFYDKYCNLIRAGETEGTYEIRNNGTRMTETYKFMGQNQFADWKISDVKEFSFVMSSEQVAAHTYEKVVETYNLSLGQTQQISFPSNYPGYVVQSYKSKNDYIASVSADGLITSNGEKGTTYIKIVTDKGNAWVKVVVGDNYTDLWYDYGLLLDSTYTQMRTLLGISDDYVAENNAYKYFTPIHDVINYFYVIINPTTQTVEQIVLYLKEGVPEADIISYMDARYYISSSSSISKLYTIMALENKNNISVAYNTDRKTISFTKDIYKMPKWEIFEALICESRQSVYDVFGLNPEEASKEKLFYFYGQDADSISAAEIGFDKLTGLVEYVSVVLSDKIAQHSDEITQWLEKQYTLYDQSDERFKTYINAPEYASSTVGITWDTEEKCLTFIAIWRRIPDFSVFVDKTALQLKTMIGEPDREIFNSYVYNFEEHELLKRVTIRFNEEITDASKASVVTAVLHENHNQERVLEFLNGKYSASKEYTDEMSYGFRTKDKNVIVKYTPSANTIDYLKSFGY